MAEKFGICDRCHQTFHWDGTPVKQCPDCDLADQPFDLPIWDRLLLAMLSRGLELRKIRWKPESPDRAWRDCTETLKRCGVKAIISCGNQTWEIRW